MTAAAGRGRGQGLCVCVEGGGEAVGRGGAGQEGWEGEEGGCEEEEAARREAVRQCPRSCQRPVPRGLPGSWLRSAAAPSPPLSFFLFYSFFFF